MSNKITSRTHKSMETYDKASLMQLPDSELKAHEDEAWKYWLKVKKVRDFRALED